jgi:hypothetical protein
LINLDLKVAAQISNTLPNCRPLEKRVVPIFLNFERQLQANDLNRDDVHEAPWLATPSPPFTGASHIFFLTSTSLYSEKLTV